MTILNEKMVKTNKAHTCFGCGRGFTKGTVLKYQSIADCGVSSFYWCPVCEEVMRTNKDFQNGEDILFTDVKDADPDVWEATRLRIEGDVND